VQSIIGKPDSTYPSGTTDYWSFASLGSSKYSSCELVFENNALKSFGSNCTLAKINYGTFGDIGPGAATPADGKTISKNISKDAVQKKWGTPDSIYLSSTTQYWSYITEGTSNYSSCELVFKNGLLTSTGSSCKTTDIDVTSF